MSSNAPEKALLVLKNADGTEGTYEKIVPAHPYEGFFTREVSALSGPYQNVVAIYCSYDLEKEILKATQALGVQSAKDIPVKGIGDLPLEKAAALYARLEI